MTLEPDGRPIPSITYAVVWKQRPNLLSKLPNLRAIFSIGAGVDHIFTDPGLPDVPIVRVVADNLTQYMTEYVRLARARPSPPGHALSRAAEEARSGASRRSGRPSDIAVGIMGLGNLGRAAAKTLLALGFRVNGWSRRRTVDGGRRDLPRRQGPGAIPQRHRHPGRAAAADAGRRSGIINYALLRELRRRNGLGGAVLINAGRGKLQKDADILRALEDGTLKEASLDVFEVEPLPKTSPLWSHPSVFVTPHAAATSDPPSGRADARPDGRV